MKLYLQQIKMPVGRLYVSSDVIHGKGNFTPFDSSQTQRDTIARAKAEGREFVFFMRATKINEQSVGLFTNANEMRQAIIQQFQQKGRSDQPITLDQINAGIMSWVNNTNPDMPGMLNDCINTTLSPGNYPKNSLFIFFGRAFIR